VVNSNRKVKNSLDGFLIESMGGWQAAHRQLKYAHSAINLQEEYSCPKSFDNKKEHKQEAIAA
jgi:hypothetical protein